MHPKTLNACLIAQSFSLQPGNPPKLLKIWSLRNQGTKRDDTQVLLTQKCFSI